MDDLFPILLFIIFILGPIIEALTKKNKQKPPQPPQRRVPPAQPSRTEEISTRSRVDESAATMVPDELWEILTGEKRSPAPSAPAPRAPTAEKRPHWDVVYEPELEDDEELDEEEVALEDVNIEARRARVEAQSLETLERHPEPIIISLEENIPSTAVRHAAFHEKISRPQVEIAEEPWRSVIFDLRNRSDLQRAFLLQEVFGKPKGLE